MIEIVKVETIDEVAYNHVKCPVCNSRLCNKPKGAKVNLIQFPRAFSGNEKMNQLLLQCHKCKSRYLFSLAE